MLYVQVTMKIMVQGHCHKSDQNNYISVKPIEVYIIKQ